MKIVISIFLAVISVFTLAQTTVVLQPNASEGKDCSVNSRLPDDNFGNSSVLRANAYTYSGNEYFERFFIDFDLSFIPANSIIVTAGLTLYADYMDPGSQFHSNASGSNLAVIQRVVTPWDEDLLTWNTQPDHVSENLVYIVESIDELENYHNIDITGLVSDYINDIDNSFGFMVSLKYEEAYRRLAFASSDYSDAMARPTLSVTYIEPSETDTCIVLIPNYKDGIDCAVNDRLPDSNLSAGKSFRANAYTFSGTPHYERSFMNFDLHGIPDNATINFANLSLYSDYEDDYSQYHSSLSGSNISYLRKVTEYWHKDSITWNNQPAYTTAGQIVMHESYAPRENYLDIDITSFIIDQVTNPDSYFGFMLQLEIEEHYRRMSFATSDHLDENVYPRLTVCYTVPTKIVKKPKSTFGIEVFPNPAVEKIRIQLIGHDKAKLWLVNSLGQKLITQIVNSPEVEIDIYDLEKGVYFVCVEMQDQIFRKKIIKQ